MNKKILIYFLLTFVICFFNNSISSLISIKFSFFYEKKLISVLFNLFYYSGYTISSIIFLNKKKIKKTINYLSLLIYLLLFLTFFEIITNSLFIIIILKFLNGYLFYNISNVIEYCICKFEKKIFNFYNSIFYFSFFLNQYVNFFFIKNYNYNYKLFYIILIFIILIFIKIFFFLEDFEMINKNVLNFKNIKNFNKITIILFLTLNYILYSLCNYFFSIYNEKYNDENFFLTTIFFSGGFSYLSIKLINLNKKNIILLFLIIYLMILLYIEYNYNKCHYMTIFLFFLSFFCFPIYFISLNLLNEDKNNENNIIFSFFNSIFNSINLICTNIDKKNIFFFFILSKIITFILLILIIYFYEDL
ncbi:hypothetical protein A33Y_030 [Candidatus Carsonella ruddii CS isolate Thao2000]|uniref:Uncharacterized protein n=1 Tax=Candidatus Carsonella ruddii CS isolate Thao2000 TaxID=1202537 RepID=J7GT62_CARRU|nr:hypothetical protein [Candidatus Carsonella ruddii]AFP83694.1 hypothetical protein A33Y_030 [Candidatus Carsonella ruddii CS isolate Thao2000]